VAAAPGRGSRRWGKAYDVAVDRRWHPVGTATAMALLEEPARSRSS